MPTDPCLTPTDSVILDTVGTVRSLEVDVRVSPGRGNPLVVHDTASGIRGVETLDPWASDAGGVGFADAQAIAVVPQTPLVLGVWVVSTAGTGRSPAIRLPGAMSDPDRKASLLWPRDPGDPWALQLPVADATNPRVDRIVATWNSLGRLDVVVKPGTPTSGATLDNLLGGAAIDETVEVRLADVMVDAGAVTIAANKIRDRRPMLPDAGVPVPLGSFSVAVSLLDPLATPWQPCDISAGSFDNGQAAALVRLERDIVANFLYWSYYQVGAGSLTGTWTIALLDISRRSVGSVGVGSLASPGNNGIARFRSAFTTPGRTLRAGLYYAFLGISAVAAAGGTPVFRYQGQSVANVMVPNSFYHRASGSTNIPTGDIVSSGHTDAFSDVATITAAVPGVPRIAIGAF